MKTTTTARTLTAKEVKSIMNTLDGSGHDIMKPKYLIERGVPSDVVESLTMKFHSDMTEQARLNREFRQANGKNSIFVNGELVESLTGVYSLSLYEYACRILNLTYESKFGRGSQARVCHAALQQWVDEQAEV